MNLKAFNLDSIMKKKTKRASRPKNLAQTNGIVKTQTSIWLYNFQLFSQYYKVANIKQVERQSDF